MGFLRPILGCVLLVVIATEARPCSVSSAIKGVMCLDEVTGKPLWEYFPPQLGIFAIESNAYHLFITIRSFVIPMERETRTPSGRPPRWTWLLVRRYKGRCFLHPSLQLRRSPCIGLR